METTAPFGQAAPRWPAAIVLGLGLALAVPAATSDAQGRSHAAGAPRRSGGVIARRGAPGAPAQPLTEVSIDFGGARYAGRVDANCTIDERATTTNTRAYYHILYPWFGYHPPADQPQWRFSLDVRRSARPGSYDQFMFDFSDGTRKSGAIQKLAGSQRMGSGTVRVSRQGDGARFDVEGRSQNGETVRATIVCPAFPKSEAAGG